MPRVAVEATLQAPMGAIRIATTHLEYYSDVQRRAQVRRLRNLHDEACQRAAATARYENEESNVTFDPTPQTTRAIVVGDFNFPPENPAWRRCSCRSPSPARACATRGWRSTTAGLIRPPSACTMRATPRPPTAAISRS
jgi:endonuclease/exonuclease/phosphatase family metal-dependent hydrolase